MNKMGLYRHLSNEITVNSPNHSSEWEVGNCYDVLWESSDEASLALEILLKHIDGSTAGTFVSDTLNDGMHNVCLDTALQAGTYYISIAETTEKYSFGISEQFIIKEQNKKTSADIVISTGSIMIIIIACIIAAGILYRKFHRKYVRTKSPPVQFETNLLGQPHYSSSENLQVGIIQKGKPATAQKVKAKLVPAPTKSVSNAISDDQGNKDECKDNGDNIVITSAESTEVHLQEEEEWPDDLPHVSSLQTLNLE